MHLKDIGWDGENWINVAQKMVQCAGSFKQGNEPSGSIQAEEFLD
jgi:hypothetical protein